MKAITIISFFLFFLTNISFAQEDTRIEPQHNVEQYEFDKLQKELDYSKTKRKLKLRENKKRPKKDIEEKEPTNFSIPGLGTGLSILAYALIIVLFGALLYVIFSNIKIDPKLEEAPVIDEEEIENIDEYDTRKLYEEALARKDYRSAIRMQFLQVLQNLSLKELILWKPDKTNRDYNREIENIEIKNEFRQLASYFEWIWYGNNDLDEQRFNSLNAFFINFIKKHHVQ